MTNSYYTCTTCGRKSMDYLGICPYCTPNYVKEKLLKEQEDLSLEKTTQMRIK